MSEWNRNTSWRQGKLLPQEAVAALDFQLDFDREQSLVIVASHDCDVAADTEGEPNIEVVVGQLIPNTDGNFTSAKNSRRCHLAFNEDGQFAEFLILNKTTVTKLALANYQPRADLTLSVDNLNTFQHWLASRYRRSAFSNQFEARLKQVGLDKKIARILKPSGELIAGLFFDVDGGSNEDKADGTPNELSIILLHQSEPDFDRAESFANAAAASIREAFEAKLFNPNRRWENIELTSIDVISEEALNYSEFKLLKRWRLDYLSLDDVPQQAIAAH